VLCARVEVPRTHQEAPFEQPARQHRRSVQRTLVRRRTRSAGSRRCGLADGQTAHASAPRPSGVPSAPRSSRGSAPHSPCEGFTPAISRRATRTREEPWQRLARSVGRGWQCLAKFTQPDVSIPHRVPWS
jgi:hypothetical protein